VAKQRGSLASVRARRGKSAGLPRMVRLVEAARRMPDPEASLAGALLLDDPRMPSGEVQWRVERYLRGDPVNKNGFLVEEPPEEIVDGEG
jgi:hypothetical protein